MPDEKSPLDRLLDAFVYGPIGFALEAEQLVPRLVERGRTTVGSQVGTARLLGQVVVRQGRRELDRQLARLRTANPCARPSRPEPPTADAATPDAAATSAAGTTTVTVAPREADEAAEEERDIVLDEAGRSARHHSADEAARLAIPDYDSLAASQVVPRLVGLSAEELEAVRRYEAAHRRRRTILARIGQLQAGR